MSWETVEVTKHGRTAIITINRPGSANALNTQLGVEMGEALAAVEADANVWTIVLTGAGNRAFCAGADMKERKSLTEAQYRAQRQVFIATYKQLMHIAKPVIAAVNGAAVGGGVMFAFNSDIIYASETARFSISEVKLGLVGGTVGISRLIGKHKAKEFLFTGKMISALEAYELGMINKVVKPEALMEEVLALCETINANAPLAVRQAKKLLDSGREVDLETAWLMEAECYDAIFHTEDRLEGLNAFNEKRAPVYHCR